MPSTARTNDDANWMWVFRPVMSRTRSAMSALPQPDINGIAQRVSHEVECHHGKDQADADRVDQPPIAVAEIFDTVGELVTPRHLREVKPEAEVANDGDGDDRVGDLERDVHDDDAERIGDQVPQHLAGL